MSKVTIVFPERTYYNEEVFEGEVEFDLEKRPRGWVDKWAKRGIHVKDDSKKPEAKPEKKPEPKKEEPKAEESDKGSKKEKKEKSGDKKSEK